MMEKRAVVATEEEKVAHKKVKDEQLKKPVVKKEKSGGKT